MNSIRSDNNILKIILLIIGILTISLFVNSCTMLNSYPQDFSVINKSFISNDYIYLLQFSDTIGMLKNRKTSISVTFDYNYDSGIILGTYVESVINNDGEDENIEKELVFSYCQPEVLYSQNLNLLFKII